MAKEQKTFLTLLNRSWKTEFPFLKAGWADEVKRRPKNCNFLCDDYATLRGRYYFFQIDFSRRRRGELSITITLSKSQGESILPASDDPEPTPLSLGAFGIWQFMQRPSYAWSIVDLEAESMALLGISSGLAKPPDVWCPTTYHQPLEKIVEEAIADVNQTLRKYVLPTLQIQAQTP